MIQTKLFRRLACCLTAIFFAARLLGETASGHADVVDVSKLSVNSDEFLVIATLQGLANRAAPRVFLFTGDQNWVDTFKREGIVHSPETLAKYRNTDDAWQDYYRREKGIRFEPLAGLDAVLEKYANLASGVVIYNPKAPYQWVPAMALASAFDLLPVTENLLKKYPQLNALPVRYDLRNRTESSFDLEQWAWQEASASCSKEGAYSINGSTDRFAMDIAVAKKLFIYRLNADAKQAPAEFAMIQTILKSLKPLSPVWGWGFPTEDLLRDAASRAGAFVMCSEVPNLSFHAQVTPGTTPYKPAVSVPEPAKKALEDKFYVAFMVNEGDTLKCAASMECFGMWLEPQRGQFAISWGVSPWILDHFPALMEYYYKTMTPKDAFFSACSGYGYFTPGYSPTIDLAAQKERVVASNARLRLGCSWAANTLGSEEKIADWLDARGLDGFVREDGKELKLTFTGQNRPIISTDWKLFYPEERFGVRKNPDEQVRRELEFLKGLEGKMTPPVLVPFYAGNPSHFAKLVAGLPADKFSFITVDEMVALAQKMGRLQILGDTLLVIAPAPDANSTRATIAATKSVYHNIHVKLAVRNLSDTPQRGQVSIKVPPGWFAGRGVMKYDELSARTGSTVVEFSIDPTEKTKAGDYDIIFTDSATQASARLHVKVAELSDAAATISISK